jgi:hypothetical protein
MSLIFKFLLTALVVLIVWWVIRFRGRMSGLKAAFKAAQKAAATEAARATGTKGVPVTLLACPKCGTFIAAGTACTCAK